MHHRLPICRRLHRRLATLALTIATFGAAAAAPPAGLPIGSIVAFLPDYTSGAYSDNEDLKNWLNGQGWVICDGNNGTPDLHNRLLLGTEHPEDVGRNVGTLHHEHNVTGETIRRGTRDVRIRDGVRSPMQIPDQHHQHKFEGKTNRMNNLPPSTRVLFIMKAREGHQQ